MPFRLGTNRIGRLIVGGTGFDPDAQAFFTAVTGGGDTLTTTEENAVNQLVLDLKSANIWTSLQAIWPFVGGTASSQKWNLKDPRDLDAAYRMTFAGAGWTHSADGVQQSNDNSTYGDTNYPQNTNDNTAGMSMGVYINGGTTATGYDLGCLSGGAYAFLIAGYGNNTFYSGYSVSNTTGAFTMPNGFFVADNNGTTSTGYRNGASVVSGGGARNLSLSLSPYLGNDNRGGPAAEATDRRYAFCFMGESLGSTEQSDLYTAVQDFNTTLSREV